MKINRQQFIDALTKVKPGLANNEIIEQSNNFIFDDDIIRTFNDEIAITHKFKTGLVGSVTSKEFYALLTKIPDEEITAEMKDDSKFVFKGKKKQTTFNINPEIGLTNIEPAGLKADVWQDLPNDFCDCVKRCTFSISKNMTSVELTGVCVAGDTVLSCDRIRATRIVMAGAVEENFILPGNAAEIINNYNPHRYYMDTNWIHFVNKENTTLSVRRISAEFPVDSVNGVFDFKGKKISLPDGLKDALDRSKILINSEMDNKEVALIFTAGDITCEAIGIVAQHTEQIDSAYKGKDFKITIDPKLLADILQRISTATIGEDKVLFKDDKGFEHVILLVPDDVELPVQATKPKAKRSKKAK